MSDNYRTTIGLEIHAELNTKTKMFCACLNEATSGELKPNSNICPVCMGHPGTLPTINKQAVKNVLKVGVALGSKLADFTEFDRKNYFYPDIPKGYQISQYKYPLVSGGSLNGVELTRIHLEEDTARSSHDQGDFSLVDFNRAGVPLMELVTEPAIHSAKEAGDFARELQLLLKTLGVAEANMEKGEMRVEANISVSRRSQETNIIAKEKLGTKVEVKNLNSFRAVERAIEYEVKRHIEALENNEKIIQETRGWNESKQATYSQRQKEDSHDYRYFPDPDLPKIKLSELKEFSIEELKKELPELPWHKRERLKSDFDLTEKEIMFFVGDTSALSYLEKVSGELKQDKAKVRLATNYILSDLISLASSSEHLSKIRERDFTELIDMLAAKELSSRAGKDILKIMFNEGGSPRAIAEKNDLLQKNDDVALEAMLKALIEANPTVVADYKAGKASALMFFVGQVMKQSKGSANPETTRILAEKLVSGI